MRFRVKTHKILLMSPPLGEYSKATALATCNLNDSYSAIRTKIQKYTRSISLIHDQKNSRRSAFNYYL